MKEKIIGREKEISRFEQYMSSRKSEFIALYGRRRVGKTFLVRELLEGRFTFRMTGKENVSTKEKLENFHYALGNFTDSADKPETWEQAFKQLTSYIEKLSFKGPKIIFFDELPWFDTKGSKFVSALEHFWNDWAAYRSDIKLIVCGSATTWMLNKVNNARGGLHNRATHIMLLAPFTLHETELYFKTHGFSYERQEIMQCYMAMGGVPYYLSLFESQRSVAQNIESLCFTRGGEMVSEFGKVFKSLFKKADNHISVVTALVNKGMGVTRQEIIKDADQTNNGNLTRLLKELEECSFIRSYVPFGKTKKDTLYQLIDPFILFHFRFMGDSKSFMDGYWQKTQVTPEHRSWCGYAFEIVCLNHLVELYDAAKNLKNPAVIVDCNHSNSGKKFIEQIRISKEVLHSMRHSEGVKALVKGLMIESYIEDGAQKEGECIYGKSITDPCLGWDKTECLIYDIAELLYIFRIWDTTITTILSSRTASTTTAQ